MINQYDYRSATLRVVVLFLTLLVRLNFAALASKERNLTIFLAYFSLVIAGHLFETGVSLNGFGFLSLLMRFLSVDIGNLLC